MRYRAVSAWSGHHAMLSAELQSGGNVAGSGYCVVRTATLDSMPMTVIASSAAVPVNSSSRCTPATQLSPNTAWKPSLAPVSVRIGS